MDLKKITFLVNDKQLEILGTCDQIKLLETDDKHAIQYITESILKNQLRDLELGPDDIQNLSIIRQNVEPVASSLPVVDVNTNEGECSNINDIIWTKKGKHTQRDIDAIHFMLELRGSEKYTKLFDDKRNVKLQLWTKLGQAMADTGFNVGPEKDMGEKLRQKFLNLTKSYMAFNKYVKNTTGTSPKKPPEFFDELDKILGDKHKTHPKYVINSINESLENMSENTGENLNNSTVENMELDITEQSSEIKKSTPETVLHNRFKNIPKSVTPKKESAIEEMRKMHKENLKEYTNHYTRMENIIAEQNNLLKEQNRQRDRFIECIEKLISIDEEKGAKRKRRARKSDSSESD